MAIIKRPSASSSPLSSSSSLKQVRRRLTNDNGPEQRNLSKYHTSLHLHGWDGAAVSHRLSEWGRERALLMLTFLQIEKVYRLALTWERPHIHVDFLTLCRRVDASAGTAPSRTCEARAWARASGTLSSATQTDRRSHMLTCTRTFRRLWNEPHSHVVAKESMTQPRPTVCPPLTDTFVCSESLKSGVKKPGCSLAFVPPCSPSTPSQL